MKRWIISLALLANPVAGDERPNIILLLSDDQTTWSMGCYGVPDVETPQMDRLAQDGLIFDRHYVSTAICMASRASIMTGNYEYRTGCNFEHGPLLSEHWSRSYPVLLRAAGYRTAFAGKFGFLVSEAPGAPGRLPSADFDRWGGGPGQTYYQTGRNPSMKRYAAEYPHSTRAYGAFGSDFIRDSAAQDRPFCLSLSFKAPHRPVTPDPEYDLLYANRTFTKPPNYGRRYGEHFSLQSRQGRQYVRFAEWGYETDYDRVMARYHQQIYAIDVALGMIREALEDAGVADRTVIVYTSDNGFLCGSHGYGSKVLPYEEASRVPLIVYDPRHSELNGQGRRCRSLTGNIDLAPTVLEWAGVPIPEDIDGRSLVPLYRDPAQSVRERLALINVWGPAPVHSLSVVSREWKYVFWPFGAGRFTPTEELYHLAADRWELSDLSSDPESRPQLLAMRRAYDRELENWNEKAVPYHGYRRFGTIFDRNLSWPEKRRRLGADSE